MQGIELTQQERETIILMRSFDGEQLAAAISFAVSRVFDMLPTEKQEHLISLMEKLYSEEQSA